MPNNLDLIVNPQK